MMIHASFWAYIIQGLVPMAMCDPHTWSLFDKLNYTWTGIKLKCGVNINTTHYFLRKKGYTLIVYIFLHNHPITPTNLYAAKNDPYNLMEENIENQVKNRNKTKQEK